MTNSAATQSFNGLRSCPLGQPHPNPSSSAQSFENQRWSTIQQDCYDSGIDITVLPFATEALASISALAANIVDTHQLPSFEHAQKIDTHTHPIPDWFRELEKNAAGRETPTWSVRAHLEFMAKRGIKHSILCVSTPMANAFQHERDGSLRKMKTRALARLLNEFCREVCRLYPQRFSWLAITPLPYVDEAMREVERALEVGAVGVGVLTNHEGLYPGDKSFDALWMFLQERAVNSGDMGKEIVFVHPTEPVFRLDDRTLVNSRPSPLRSGLGEFYFETARAISSITAPPHTMFNFPNVHWRISHGAGAFPDISERFLLGVPGFEDRAKKVYRERLWYDSAGPVYPNQIKGLTENMRVPLSQMVFGTDYPYGIGFWDVDDNINALVHAEWLNEGQKEGVLWRNAESLWMEKIEAFQPTSSCSRGHLG